MYVCIYIYIYVYVYVYVYVCNWHVFSQGGLVEIEAVAIVGEIDQQ